MRVPVLTYHAVHVDGTEYGDNDHIGFEQDLEWLNKAGWRVISIQMLVDALLSRQLAQLPERSIVLTLDDGSWFDWYDLPHPHFGLQRGMVAILRDFRNRHGTDAQPFLHATSFVIVSPLVRESLDQSCLIGLGWWGDDWWRNAHREGLISIASHSWDHRHASIPESLRFCQRPYGDFQELADFRECDWQIRQAQSYLNQVLREPPASVFAYPFGHAAEILVKDYFPRFGEDLGLHAAFTTDPEPVSLDSMRWQLPRFVFRRDWTAPEELSSLLRSI